MTDWQVITGDCLEVMGGLDAGSVDAVITDLPYGNLCNYRWDNVIPFAPMWAAVKGVLKSNGTFITTSAQPFTSALVSSNPEWFKYELIWKKSTMTGFLHAKNQPMRAHENILVFSGGASNHASLSANRMTYIPQMREGRPYVKKNDPAAKFRWNKMSRPSNSHRYVETNNGTRYPTSIVEIASGNHGLVHPTQKPVALYEYLIRTYTNPGELVLDITAGSGTTGVACIQTGRRFIGIEIDPGYADIARARIAKAAEQARQGELFAAAD